MSFIVIFSLRIRVEAGMCVAVEIDSRREATFAELDELCIFRRRMTRMTRRSLSDKPSRITLAPL